MCIWLYIYRNISIYITIVNIYITLPPQNDVKWINYIDPPMHIWQGVNQQNLSISNAKEILITSEEVITTNQNHFTVFSSDTLTIDLK